MRDSGADAPIDVMSMDDVRSAAVAERRFVTVTVAVFGGLAMLLAAIGVYGVVALATSERSGELAVRLALGAAPTGVFALVMGEALRLAAAGIAAGAVLGALGAPAIAGQLFGVSSADPLTYGSVTLALVLAAVLGAAVPARRAMRTDPATALR
jgi:putative ABC transport system permease protein